MKNKNKKKQPVVQQSIQKIEGQNYIVIGTSHLGLDLAVLNVIKTVADFYNAKILHTGPLATIHEISMWRRQQQLLVTWENAAAEKYAHKEEIKTAEKQKIQSKMTEVRKKLKDAVKKQNDKQTENLEKQLQALKEKSTEVQTFMTTLRGKHRDITRKKTQDVEMIRKIQWGRISAMQEVFGVDNIEFICNDSLHIPETPMIDGEVHSLKEYLGERYIEYTKPLGSHLNVTSVPANNDKMSGQPITDRIYDMLSKKGGSHVVPHMTTNVRPFPRSGLNQAYNYITTGCLQICKSPERNTDAYLSSAVPACVLVSLDKKNDEFHTQRLRIKQFRNPKTHRQDPHILHDGLVFNNSGEVYELDSEARTIFSTDMHAPHEHPGVVGAIRALNVLYKPAFYIDLGDTADNEGSSPHTQNQPAEREGLRIINDIKALYRVLDAMANEEEFPWHKTRVLIDSNHGEWIPRFISKMANLKNLIDWEVIAQNLPQWNVMIRNAGEDKSFYLGDLCARHGDNEGSIARAKRTWGNYIGGHHHGYYEFGDAVFLGPGCRLGPKFLNNRVTGWQNQIASATTYKNQTCKHAKTVLHSEDTQKSRFCYRGEIWETPFYKHQKQLSDYKHIV